MINMFKSIHSGDKTLEDIEQEKNKFKKEINIIKQGNSKKRSEEQRETIDNIENLYKSRQEVVNMFNNYAKNVSKSIHKAKHEGKGLKILAPNQMLKRLPIALAKMKAGNNSESLLNEIRQIVCSLYRSKGITKMLYNNIINSIKASYKMGTIFMNSENSRTSEYQLLLLNLTNKIDLRSEKTVALSNLSIYYTWKNIKNSYNNKFKISALTWNEEFKLPDGSYSISDIQDYFQYILKKHSESVDNRPIRIYVNKFENRITFKIKSGYYLELLTPETMKLLGSTESKITEDIDSEIVPHLEIIELVLVHCNLVNNDYQQDSRILYTFVSNKLFGSLLEILPSNHVFLKTFNS